MILVSLPRVMIALTLPALSAAPPALAEAAGPTLTGCWRHYASDIGSATRITLPSGDPGLSWGVDPETGKELIGMVPHSELCFSADGSMTTAHFGVDEGLGDSGTYRFDGGLLTVHSDKPGDGWLFGFENSDSSCRAKIQGDVLYFTECDPPSEWLELDYTRASP